jgi:class 3 adenylate cyclase/DNA-binding transcriptional MerR regulator
LPKLSSQKWIESNEVLEKCEISKPILDFYIKLGLIPRPIVRHKQDGLTGYFPPDVLNVIEKVKQFKEHGETMEEIVSKMKNTAETAEESKTGEKRKSFFDVRSERMIKDVGSDNRGLHLTLVDVQTPAYLMNYQFEIEWINEHAEKAIFGKNIRNIRDIEGRNVFRLFLNWEFTNFIRNWEEFLRYHMTFFKARQSREQLERLYSNMSQKELAYLQNIFDSVGSVHMQKVNQQYITMAEHDGHEERYIVYATFFREGVFFLYLPAESVPVSVTEPLSNREVLIQELLQQRLPTLVSFSALAADLQGATRISAELPPEEYFELISSMSKLLEESVRKFNGIFGNRIGDRIVYYFLKKQDPNYIANCIHCALEMRESMTRFSMEWKLRKKWYNELCLNIGINEGREYFSAAKPSPVSVEFRSLGDTIDHASQLAELTRSGSIMATKNLINQLDEDKRKGLRFGVVKRVNDRDVFIEQVFSCVSDLVKDDSLRRERFSGLAALAVTEILGKV